MTQRARAGDFAHATSEQRQQRSVFPAAGIRKANHALASAMQQRGYSILPWIDASWYDSNYAPTSFGDILLSDRSTLTKVNKTADFIAFYNLALHSSNSSIIAFTPIEPPQFSYSSAILEEILKDGGRTLVFTAQA